MQILAIALYSGTGRRRVVDFRPGELNVVTGAPGAGKSALLDIVEYCTGRDTLVMPVGPIAQTVEWYGLLFEHNDTRVFIGRPAPKEGAASTSQAMIEIGADLELPEAGELKVNADTNGLRDQIGRLIGIDENAGDPTTPWAPSGLEAHLGHATFLCLQRQGEVANRELLFHRQGEAGIADAIRETLPYFLGALPADQAVLRQALLAARRDLRRAEADLVRANLVNEDVDVSLLSMIREAVGAGLLPEDRVEGRAEMFVALRAGVEGPSPPHEQTDDVTAARRHQLERDRQDLRIALRAAGDQAALLRSLGSDENAYVDAVQQQLSRLSSIDLLNDSDGDPRGCPVCEQPLAEPDATVSQMRAVVAELSGQLEGVEEIRPRRSRALAQLTADTDGLRQQLRATETALAALAEQDEQIGRERSAQESQAFTRGRIQHFLDTTRSADEADTARLADLVRVRSRAIEALEARLDPDIMREELTARLSVVAADMTMFAQRLELEHSGAVWLNVKRLTVMVDSPEGAVPLFRVGSAANWVGAHLVAHLALHRYFTRHQRPVPRFLMLDQPTQAYYPSDVEQEEGVPEREDDRQAVRRMFELMRDVCQELSPDFQIIVCDHANLPDDWFQEAVRHNWRGEKLIPREWIEELTGEDGPPTAND